MGKSKDVRIMIFSCYQCRTISAIVVEPANNGTFPFMPHSLICTNCCMLATVYIKEKHELNEIELMALSSAEDRA
ncbi:hypothetical protein LCGC14_1959250 [marine sediment metagenome]|uniref:Uncharacterized protein n=1 Tax=marine sediment metagenome TaxID=412755 RepID=A0A0F9HTF9_9ZZZZ